MIRIRKRNTSAATVLVLALFVSPLLTGLFPLTSATTEPAKFGNTSIGAQVLDFSSNKCAFKIELPASGTVQDIMVYFSNSKFNVKAGLYGDENGLPGQLVSESRNDFIVSPGWSAFRLHEPVYAGTYWVAVISDSSQAQGAITFSGSEVNRVRSEGKTYLGKELSSAFGPAAVLGSGSASIYLTVTPLGQRIPNKGSISGPTPNPSPSPAATSSPSFTPKASPTPALSLSPSVKPRLNASPSPTATPVPSPTFTPSPTDLATAKPKATQSPKANSDSSLATPAAAPSPSAVLAENHGSDEDEAPEPTTLPVPSGPTPTPSVAGAKIQVYSDSACTVTLSSFSWGSLSPGATRTVSLYVRNEGTVAVTLTKAMTNLSPASLGNFLTLTWNYDGQTLGPQSTLAVTLTLSVAASTPVTPNFGFDTIVSGVGN